MENLSNFFEGIINKSVMSYDNTMNLNESSFEELISMGELVDRLSIVNFKLYKLKDEVMNKKDDHDFKIWASVEDVKLVKERSRLKKCIDEKLIYVVSRIYSGDPTAGFNPEVKKYGN